MKSTLLVLLFSLVCIAWADEWDVIQGEEDEGAQTGVDAMGDTICDDYMCVSVTRKGDELEYVMESQDKQPLGWMAVGFGTIMANSKMVIMWANVDHSVTLSQRRAPMEWEPHVDKSPPFKAVPSKANTLLKDVRPRLAFTRPAIPDETQKVIWAFGRQRPDGNAIDTFVPRHISHGRGKLNLNQTFSPPEDAVEPVDPPLGYPPLQPYQRSIVVHAVASMVGYLVILPAGTLLARYMRTFTSNWFQFHWVIQFIFGGSLALFGFAAGRRAVEKSGSEHYNDSHKKLGLALLLLLLVQATLGGLVHFRQSMRKLGGPLHACLGLILITLAFYQTRSGYKEEWPLVTGRPAIQSMQTAWLVLVIVVPVLYTMGLTLLPRQLALSRKRKMEENEQNMHMETVPLTHTVGEDEDDLDPSLESLEMAQLSK